MMLFNAYVIAFFLSLTFTTNAQLQGKWPAPDKPPPVNSEWTALVDLSKVPNAPVVQKVGSCSAQNEFCYWSCNECTRDTDIVQCPNKQDWGLTFDDGPTPYTDTLLDYLASQNIQLTFFIVGSRVTENPQILQKTVNAGHQIGVHTWSHTPLTTQSNEQIIAEIKWTESIIKSAVGVTPKYMRPPYGDIDDRVRAILIQLGYKVVIWDKDTNDWESANNPSFQMDWVEGNFTTWIKEVDQTGHISLEHDLYQQTAAQGPKVVPILQGAGFNIKPVSVCVGDDYPYLESVALTSITNTTAPAPPQATTNPDEGTTTNIAANTTDSTDSTFGSQNDGATSSANSNTTNEIYLSLAILILGTFMIV